MYRFQRRIAAGGISTNRKAKSELKIADTSTETTSTTTTSTESNRIRSSSAASDESAAKPRLSKDDIQRGKQDIQTINNDLRLLSTLLGRPISIDELPQLTQSVGRGGSASAAGGGRSASSGRRATTAKASTTTTTTTTATTTTTTTPKPTNPPLSRESELLKQLLLQQDTKVAGRPEYYGKTDEAILATILKQRGIGPAHNNLPKDVSIKIHNGFLHIFLFLTIKTHFTELDRRHHLDDDDANATAHETRSTTGAPAKRPTAATATATHPRRPVVAVAHVAGDGAAVAARLAIATLIGVVDERCATDGGGTSAAVHRRRWAGLGRGGGELKAANSVVFHFTPVEQIHLKCSKIYDSNRCSHRR